MRRFSVLLLLAMVCIVGYSAFSAEVTTVRLVPVHRHHRWHWHWYHRHHHHHRRVVIIRVIELEKLPPKRVL